MNMYREPINTEQKTATQPSLCSVISQKLRLRSAKSHGEGNDSSSPVTAQGKAKTDDSTNKNKDKKKDTDKNEIKNVLKKLRKTTPFLPRALKSPYAYEKGKKSCEICNVDKEAYKSVIKSIKVIELIVDDVINKEQKEMLDKEDEEQDINKASETVSAKGEKKLSIQFEIYCQKDIDHNLKCVLVKLQKTIGDTILQVCYCKAKKNPGDEKCKKYDVSVNVLEQLKFEYTNLTNSIIRLFKTPPPKQKTSPEVCVACMKEEITDCTKTLEDMLKNGRNLKVTMRNDDAGQEKCCSRTYPHVHALVQDKHVVLKFELPFEVTHPNQEYDQFKDREGDVKSTNTQPYDEWPESFAPESAEESEHSTEDKKNRSSMSNKSMKSFKNTSPASSTPGKDQPPETKSLKSGSTAPEKDLTSRGSKGSKSKSSVQSSPSTLKSSGSKPKANESPSSEKYCGCNFDDAYDKMKAEPNENKENPQTPKPLNLDRDENKDINSQEPKPTNVEQAESQTSSQKAKPKDAEQTENQTSPQKAKPKNDEQTKSHTSLQKSKRKSTDSSSYSGSELGSNETLEEVGSSGSFTPIKHRKQVSFPPNKNKEEHIYYMGKTTHTVYQMGETKAQSVFKNLGDKHEPSPTSSKNSDLNFEKGRESTLTAVDSVVLVKNKYSLSGKSKTFKELEQSHTSGKPFFNVPQCSTEPTTSDLQRKASRTLSKQQVNEVLKDLSATKLLSVSFPAECCKNNQTVNDFKCVSDLPFSASLHSLPLDQDDLNHITQAVEKLMSNEAIVLIPDCDDEWEIEYADTPEDDEDKQEWHKAFAARDTDSNMLIEIQTGKPVIRKKVAKGQTQKDVQNLPTIKEEDENVSRKSSLSKNKGLMNKNKSTSSFRSTELRFCTVEYTNFKKESKISDQVYGSIKTKSKTIPHYHEYPNDGYFKINPQLNYMENIKDISKMHVKGDSLKSCSYLIKSQSTESIKIDDKLVEKCSKRCYKTDSLTSRDEMIMFDVIYLTSDSDAIECVSSMDSSNYILKPDHSKMKKNISSLGFCQDDDERKEVLTQQEKQNVGENVLSKNGCKSYGRLHPVSNNSIKNMLENHTYCDVNSSTGNFDCNNLKCIVTKTEQLTSIECCETEDGKENLLSNKSNENAENKIKDKSTWKARSIANASKNSNGKTPHDNFPIQYRCKNVNQKSANIWSNSTKLGTCSLKEHFSNNKTNVDFVCCKVIENSESKINLEVPHSTKLKSINNCSHIEQKVLDGMGGKEQTSHECLSLNYNSIPVENKVNIKRHNLNRRSYFISKKPSIKIVESLNTSNGTAFKLHRKIPTILSNTGTSYKSSKFKIDKPQKKFPRVTLVVSHDEIPCLEVSPQNHEIISAEENFGLMKSYMNVKNTYNLESDTALISPTQVATKHHSAYDMTHLTHESKMRINSSPDIEKLSSSTFQTNSFILDPIVSDKKDNRFSSKPVGTFYLFDINGQPLTDGSGRPLRNMTGETLLKLDETGFPLCDLNNTLIFDSSGNTVGDKQFNPAKAPLLDTLKVFTPSGYPMVLYDFAGRPLTSISGTMLVDSDGKGLLRFNCTGKPVSDFRGKPIFDIRGKQVVETE